MNAWEWAAVGAAAWLTAACVTGPLIGRWMRGTVTITDGPAGGDDPASPPRTAPESSLSGPTPTHGPIVARINVHDDGCIWKWTAATGRWQCVWNEHAEQDWDAGLRDELAP